jgi:pimeloyl-ACP methyl ester carboxylesterase
VVLESGFGGWSIDWASVQPELSTFATVCSYDRAGLGWSERAEGAATRTDIATRLHLLLEAADVPPPYVLVGHSLGGLYIRQFAREFPKDVAGMVFVDSSHEEMGARASEKDRREAMSQVRLLRYGRFVMPFGVQRLMKQPVANASSLRESDHPAAYGIGYRTSSYFALYDEVSGLLQDGLQDSMKLEPIPDVPISVLVAQENLEGDRGAFWEELQSELADLSPDSRYEIAKDSSHFIQVDRPDLVVAAIKDVLERT